MKQNKRNIIITGIIITFLILLILIISINKESIKILGDRIRQQLNASSGNTVVDYEIINYDGENIELLFIARNEKGIERVLLPDMELTGKGRTTIGYDRTLKEGEVYQLKTKSEEDNKEELHTFLVTMKPKISISNKDVLGDGTTETAKIEYPDNDNITKYYSLDNGETWQVYTGEIDVPKGETENILAKIEWN